VHSGFDRGDTSSCFWRANSTIRIAFFGSQPDENNEADLRQDVDGHSAGEQAGSRSANPAS
jgi:hypothetical protein